MKQTPKLDRVQHLMKPGELTLHGFLGNDTRKLADILAADNGTVHNHGISHSQIADRLAEMTEKGRDLMEAEVMVDRRYAVTVRDDRGVLPSPWGDGNFGKGEVHMKDTQTGKEYRWNALNLHLIREHGFYGGVGSDYRIDPNDIIHALDLRPVNDDKVAGEITEGE